MRFACEYPDEINGKTHVSVITREEWLNELTENMISWAEDKLGSKEYAGWVPIESVLYGNEISIQEIGQQ